MDLPVAIERRGQHRILIGALLVGNDAVVFLLVLVFIQIGGVEKGISPEREGGRDVGNIGDLEISVGAIDEEAESAGVIDVVRRIGE